MIVRYITRVRRADPAVRTRHAFFWAVGVTGFAAVLWVATLPVTFKPLPSDDTVAAEAPRPWSSFFERAKEQLAAVSGAREESAADTIPTTTTSIGVGETLELSPEALAEARARAAIEYVPPATTSPTTSTVTTEFGTTTATGTTTRNQPRVVRIATTTSAVASSAASTTR